MGTPSDEVTNKIQELIEPKGLLLPQVVACHQWLNIRRLMRRPGCIIGDSRTGKSSACKLYIREMQPARGTGKVPTIPILYMDCPPKLLPGGFLRELIQSLKYGGFGRTKEALRRKAALATRAASVEMIILDEAQNLSLDALSELRRFAHILNISFVLVGTYRLKAVIDGDEQVKSRCDYVFYFSALEHKEMRDVTAMWEKHILPFSDPSNLTNAKVQEHLIQATQGYVGNLDRILLDAAALAIYKGKSHLDYESIREVTASHL